MSFKEVVKTAASPVEAVVDIVELVSARQPVRPYLEGRALTQNLRLDQFQETALSQPREYWQKLVQILENPVIGPGCRKEKHLSQAEALHDDVLDFVGTRQDFRQADFILVGEEQIIEAIKRNSQNATLCARLTAVFRHLVQNEKLEEGYRAIARQAISNPAQAVEQISRRLMDDDYGIGADFDVSQPVLETHNRLIAAAREQRNEVQFDVFRAYNRQCRLALKSTDDPTRMAVFQKMLMGSPNTAVPSVTELLSGAAKASAIKVASNRANAESYWAEVVSELTDPRIGINGVADVSGVTIKLLEAVRTQVARQTSERQHTFMTAAEQTLLPAIEERHPNPNVDKEVAGVYTETVDALCAEAFKVIVDEFSLPQAREPADYWKNHLVKMTNPHYGLNTRADLTGAFIKKHAHVLARVATKEGRSQRAFVVAGIDAILNQIPLEENPDAQAMLAYLVLHLLSDSAIAQEMARREVAGDGGREEVTLEPLKRYLIHKALGVPLESSTRSANQEVKAPETDQDHQRLRAVLSAFGHFIASRDPGRTAPQRLLCQAILAANRDKQFRAEGFNERSAAIRTAYLHPTENMSGLIKVGNFLILYEYLDALKIHSPLVYYRLIARHPVFLGSVQKAKRYHPTRIEAGDQALAEAEEQDKTQEEQFYAAYRQSGKLYPDLVTLLPRDEFIQQVLTAVFTLEEGEIGGLIKEKTDLLARQIIDSDTFSGLGDEPPGLIHTLSGEIGEKGALSKELFDMFCSQALARISSSEFNTGNERLQHFIAFELLVLGLMMRETPGESEALKTEVRETFIPLLLAILLNQEQYDPETKKPFEFAQPVREMANRVLAYCLPYWSKEGQRLFVDTYQAKISNESGGWQLIEERNWNRIMTPLAVRQNPELPGVEGESKKGIRPIASYIAEKTLELLASYPYLAGKTSRRSIIDVVMEEDYSSFVYQAIDLIPWIAPNRFSDLQAIFNSLGQEDQAIKVERTDPPPRNMREFIQAGDRLRQAAEEALLTVQVRFEQAVRTIAGVSQPLLTIDAEGKIIAIPEMPILTTQLVEEGEATLKELEVKTGLEKDEQAAQRLIAETIETIDQLDPASLAQKILEMVDAHKEELPVDKIVEAISQVLTFPTDKEGVVASGLPTTFIGWSMGGATGAATEAALAFIGALITHAQVRQVSAEAIQKIVGSIFEDKEAARILLTGLAERTGVTARAGQVEQARMQVLAHISQLLADQVARQQVIQTFRKNLTEAEAQRLAEIQKLKKEWQTFQREAAQTIQNNIARQVDLELSLAETKTNAQIEAAKGVLEEYEATYPELARQLARIASTTYRAIFANARAFADWVSKVGDPKGSLATIANHYEQILRQYGLTKISLPLPTPEDLLGHRGPEAVALLKGPAEEPLGIKEQS